jgi:Holliday junction resolvasome RuvABC endonuclease subunit
MGREDTRKTLLVRADQSGRLFVGIDMSLNNPGVAMINTSTRHLKLIFFRNRGCEDTKTVCLSDESFGSPWLMTLICCERVRAGELASFGCVAKSARYLSTLQPILSLIQTERFSCGQKALVTAIGIENYAFNMSNTSSQSTLMELGGCLRLCLSSLGLAYEDISPTKVKKVFSDNGRANKRDMFNSFREIYRLPDLQNLLKIGTTKQIPHPVEDLVDAFAVAVCLLVS